MCVSRAETIYPIRKRIEQELAKIEKDPLNRDVLTRYYKVRTTEVNPATVLTELVWLNKMSKMFCKKFEDAGRLDLEDLIFKVDQLGNKDNTKNRIRRILKCFYRWLKGFPKGDYPPEVKWISMKKVPLVTITAEDLIPFEEAVRISEFALNLRDKSLIQGKVDAGCRIGEILTVKIGEVRFNDAGAVLYSDGKTGYQPIILTWSAATLAQWMNIHPFRNDKDAPLFCLLDRASPMQMSYHAAFSAFKKCVKKAGITDKRVWFHLLKHVSCTEDARRGMPQSFRNYKHHWTPNSRMNAVYEHLSQSDIQAIQAETWKSIGGGGKSQTRQAEQVPLTRNCKRCNLENPRDSKFCDRCGLIMDGSEVALNAVAKAKVNAFIDRLSGEPEKLEKFVSMIP